MSLILNGGKPRGNKRKLLIDGDGIVHAAANAADGRGYNITGTTLRFRTLAEAKQWCTDQCLDPSLIEPVTFKPDPLNWATNTVDEMLVTILDDLDSDDYLIFVKGEGNFRHELYPEYKANRISTKEKPIRTPEHLHDCYKYIIEKWCAIPCDGEEADDQCGIHQDGDNTIIVSKDKDLLCVPGYNYNWSKCIETYVTKVEGLRNFYKQLIVGDTSDNIPGLSMKKPFKRTYKTDPIDAMDDETDMYLYVRKGYEAKYGDDWENNMLLNGRLLWIRTKEGELWRG